MSLIDFLKDTGKARDELRFKPNGRIEKVLGIWVSSKITEAKERLRESDRSVTQTLESSIRPEIESVDEKVIVEVLAEDYYDYINKGVSGVQRSFGSPYSFKSLGVGSDMVKSFQEFIKRRNIQSLTWNSNEGQVTKILQTASDYKGAAYVLAKATKKRGIKPSYFMDETFTQESINELARRLGTEIKQIFK